MQYLLRIVFCIVSFSHLSHQHICEPCTKDVKCPERECPGSQVLGECGCCMDCARQLGDECGGKFQEHGICEPGLKCATLEPDPGLGGVIMKNKLSGICMDTGNFQNCDDVCSQSDPDSLNEGPVIFAQKGKRVYFDFRNTNYLTGKWIFCNCKPDSKGWMVIQRRITNIEKFSRPMWVYKQGFGTSKSDYWLGLDTIHEITKDRKHELKVSIVLSDEKVEETYFREFSIGDASEKYKLHVKATADITSKRFANMHNGMYFSAKDQDNDKWESGRCALFLGSGWWFNQCTDFNLNGVIYGIDPFGLFFDVESDAAQKAPDRVTWDACTKKTIIATEMSIRPL